jgi:transcriptional regulator with XRE-family HTH domain
MKDITERIKKLRVKAGFSHEFMAGELKLSQVSYTKIENNSTKLTVDRLYQIAQILKVEVAELLGIELNLSMTQNNNDSATGYLQKIENFNQENKDVYERLLAAKDETIELLRSLLGRD